MHKGAFQIISGLIADLFLPVLKIGTFQNLAHQKSSVRKPCWSSSKRLHYFVGPHLVDASNEPLEIPCKVLRRGPLNAFLDDKMFDAARLGEGTIGFHPICAEHGIRRDNGCQCHIPAFRADNAVPKSWGFIAVSVSSSGAILALGVKIMATNTVCGHY